MIAFPNHTRLLLILSFAFVQHSHALECFELFTTCKGTNTSCVTDDPDASMVIQIPPKVCKDAQTFLQDGTAKFRDVFNTEDFPNFSQLEQTELALMLPELEEMMNGQSAGRTATKSVQSVCMIQHAKVFIKFAISGTEFVRNFLNRGCVRDPLVIPSSCISTLQVPSGKATMSTVLCGCNKEDKCNLNVNAANASAGNYVGECPTNLGVTTRKSVSESEINVGKGSVLAGMLVIGAVLCRL